MNTPTKQKMKVKIIMKRKNTEDAFAFTISSNITVTGLKEEKKTSIVATYTNVDEFHVGLVKS